VRVGIGIRVAQAPGELGHRLALGVVGGVAVLGDGAEREQLRGAVVEAAGERGGKRDVVRVHGLDPSATGRG